MCRKRGSSKPIDSSITVPQFDGSGDLELFLKRFQSIAAYYNWDDSELLFRLEQSIQDNAQYVMLDAPPAKTVNEFISTLRSRFGFVANAEQYRAELSHLRRGTMSIHALNLEVRRLVNKAFPGSWSRSTEVYARDAFLRALDNMELRNRILMTMPPPETLAGAYELAVRAYAVDSEPSRQDRERPYRARVVGSAFDTRLKETPDQVDVIALQQQIVELQAAMQKIAAGDGNKEPISTSTVAPAERPSCSNQSTGSRVVCYHCHQMGHMARNCSQKKTKAAVSHTESSQANVLTTKTRRRVKVYLPIRYQRK